MPVSYTHLDVYKRQDKGGFAHIGNSHHHGPHRPVSYTHLDVYKRQVFICCTFGLFTDGLSAFDEAYARGDFDKVVTTDLTYLPPEIYSKPYFLEADMDKFIASTIDFMNHDVSLSNVLATTDKIHGILEAYNNRVMMEE